MLLQHDIRPIMVFDGRNLPAKADTELKRRESRLKAKQMAKQLTQLGKTTEAETYYKQCLEITPEMAHKLIVACRQKGVDCIVSPYESDAQLAFFSIKGVAQCILTEDSDLLVYGCEKVLFKLDSRGNGKLVESPKIPKAIRMREDQYSFEKFRFMCILSGCDYVPSLSGVGLKKALDFIRMISDTDPNRFLNRIPTYLKIKAKVTETYKDQFMVANATFLHQLVFDPYRKALIHLRDPGEMGTDPKYLDSLGEKFEDQLAYGVAMGNLDPISFTKIDAWEPRNVPQYSIWSGIFTRRNKRTQKNTLDSFLIRLKQPLTSFVSSKPTPENTDTQPSTLDDDIQIIEPT